MKLSKSSRLQLETAAAKYHEAVDRAVPYLQHRGLDRVTVDGFRLGYVADPLPGDADYKGRLAIPYITADGSVVDIRFRSVGADNGPKYLSRPSAQVRLFNVKAFLEAGDTIYITEGEIDTITLTQMGLPSVGVPGASNWQRHWALLFNDFDHVNVVCDGDQAGRDFGRKVAAEVEGSTILHLPDGQDVNQMFTEQGDQAVREAVAA